MTPEEIIEGFRQNKQDTLVYAYSKVLPNVISLLAKDKAKEMATDLAWQAITIFWEKCQKPDFVLNGSPLAYIYRICRNKWLDRLKTKEQLVETLPELPSNFHDPFEEYPNLWEIVEKELQKMRKTCQEILNLRRDLDDYNEITRVLQISYENARYRYSTCLTELIKRIQENNKK